MLECEDFDNEIGTNVEEKAPDLSVLKKKTKKKALLDDDELESVFSDDSKHSARISNRTDRISSRKEVKKITVKKTKAGQKLDMPIETLKCVQTKNSVNTKNTTIEELYSKETDVDSESECIDIGKEATFVEAEYDEYDDDDRKIATTKQNLSDNDVSKLKEIIKLYLNVDESCTKLSVEVKELRSEKKQYEEKILDFMGEQNKEKITCKDSVLRKQVKQVQAKPKEEDILQTLTNILKDADAAQEITKKIVESVPFEEKVTLKREKEGEVKGKKK